MTDRSTGPRCGNNPNTRLTPGDRKAVDDFKARLALQAAVKPYIERAAWVDFDPLMEVIAATVWEHCSRDSEDMPQLVCDDPRTIAAFAAAVARAHAAAVPAPATDRAALSAKLWEIAEHHIVAEWICCEPLDPKHGLCAKGYAALGMARTLLVDSPEAWNPNAPLLDAILALLPAPADRAAVHADAPVKQRADCTELEWAVQERARFERLYTRESVRADLAEQRADTAARDAEIYQQRLERLGDGYTEQRKRAEAMERAMESTAADASAHRFCHMRLMAQCQRAERAEAEAERLRASWSATCICGHPEAQHFEDACLVCDCGDYLSPAAAREVIASLQDAARRAPDRAAEFTAADLVAALRGAGAERDKIEAQAVAAGRAAVLREAAQHLYTALFPAVYADLGQKAAEGVNRAASELRRLADETQQPEAEPTAQLLALATVLEVPRPGTAIPLQLRRSYGHTDRWAICDREGRRWHREHGWVYEAAGIRDEALRDATRYTLAEAVPLARKLAAAQQPKEARL